ncbi:MAG TPA: uridine phosphorylase [Candidatus Korarchaeota archaeon]|nr:uridine phosphorylase [Candidatus Korarchaeota archaeon]
MKEFKSAEEPELKGGVQYHIRISPKDVKKYVLLPGDPGRAEKIAKEWDEHRFISGHREYVIYVGKYKGTELMVCSTGIGGPAAGIAIEELARVGANTFIRVGSTGSILPEARVGDLIISTGAVRLDGTSKQYVIPEYPALANYEVVMALIEAAESLGYRYHVGITASTDSFYVGQGRRGYGGYWQSWMENLIPDLQKAKVINFEMETATIFTLSSLFGKRAGAVCAVYADRVRNEFGVKGEKESIRVANEAVRILAEWDEIKRQKGKRYFYPSLRREVID